jgi:hypothetical protein
MSINAIRILTANAEKEVGAISFKLTERAAHTEGFLSKTKSILGRNIMWMRMLSISLLVVYKKKQTFSFPKKLMEYLG